MNVVRGRVRKGYVELDTTLPDGSEVAVVTGDTEPFDLNETDVAELQVRIAGADGGQTESADAVLNKLRAGR